MFHQYPRTLGWPLLIAVIWTQVGLALVGDNLRVNPRNGWRAFEVISQGDDPAGDTYTWALPTAFDGIGAWIVDENTLRLEVNHETNDATISEVNLRLDGLLSAIHLTRVASEPSGVGFVASARQAYGRWTNDGGLTWINSSGTANTNFFRFCSGQSYAPDTFGSGRGFVDPIYITGEEGRSNRMFALDLRQRDFYQLSGVAGNAAGGLGGMPYDSFENAALLDTGETDHVALLLSPDGGSRKMKLYVGEKGKNVQGHPSTGFLARNGLAFGSYYYLNDSLPAAVSTDGSFGTNSATALTSSKFEDVDTSPSEPTRAVLGDQDSGLFTFDFDLAFSSGSFQAASSGFSITRIQPHIGGVDGSFGDADNVDWSAPTQLGGVEYSEGLIFVNEDSGTANGETWMIRPDGIGLVKIADTVGATGATETSGILDISELVGYVPGSVLVTNNQGSNSSLSVLINQLAAMPVNHVALSGDYNDNSIVDAADFTVWRDHFGAPAGTLLNDPTGIMIGDTQYAMWTNRLGMTSAILPAQTPEPASGLILLAASMVASGGRRGRG